MCINKAIDRAYKVARERNWDRVYWAIDLHGTCLESTYDSDKIEFINAECIQALRAISAFDPRTRIILWSSCNDSDKEKVTELFKSNMIRVDWFNENPEVENTATGNFEEKFYFSILIDDKAGFDPDTDWRLVLQSFFRNTQTIS